MWWFLVLQGVGVAALGVFVIARDMSSFVGGLVMIVVGLAWAGVAVIGRRFQMKSEKLREAMSDADPHLARQNDKQKRLLWWQWALFGGALLWISATAPFVESGQLWSLLGAGALLVAMFCVMLYRMFINANLDAEAQRALSASLGGAEQEASYLGKKGGGVLAVAVVVIILVGIAVDEFAGLPVKFMSLLWYAVGISIVWAVGATAWRWLRRRGLTERQ